MHRLFVILCLIFGCTKNFNPSAPQLDLSDLPPPPLPMEYFEDEMSPRVPGSTDTRPFYDLHGKSPSWKECNFELFSVKTKPTDTHPTYIIVTPFGDRAYISPYDIGAYSSRGISCGSMSNCKPQAAVIEGGQAYLILRHQVYLFNKNLLFELVFDQPQYQFSTFDTTNRKTFLASDRYGKPVGILELVGTTWQVRPANFKPLKKGKSRRMLAADGP